MATLGVGVRAAFLFLAGDLEPHGDESNYLYLALCWNRFSLYSDCVQYLWPPGYPLFLALFVRLFGFGGIFAAKLCQALLAGVIGSTVMLLADRLFTRRAALVAGAIWCFYLPLIGFTHYLWPETLFLAVFLPGVYLFITWWQRSERPGAGCRRLLAAGILIGLSLWIKEVGLWWCPLLCGLILYRDRRISIPTAASRAMLFALGVVVVVLPWTLRNYEVYGRFAPVGATLGQNAYFGLNGFYINFDYAQAGNKPPVRISPRLVSPAGPGWERSDAPNILDRSAENVRRAAGYARQHPGFAARTRIKKLADWATPLSFFVRHYALDRYDGALGNTGVRRVLLVCALLLPVLVLAGAIPGFWESLRDPSMRRVLGVTLLYFTLATALVNGMSRYRMVIEPLLIVLAAGFIACAGRPRRRRSLADPCVVGWIVLGVLWYINAAEVTAFVKNIW